MPTSVSLESQALCQVIVESVDGDRLVAQLPGTDYRLHLHLPEAAGAIAADSQRGGRVEGVIRAKALRIHTAAGGGQFIEPVSGEPRIIAGRLIAVDTDARTLLMRAAVPMLVEPEENRDLSPFQPGQLVTFYVESGATFTPAAP